MLTAYGTLESYVAHIPFPFHLPVAESFNQQALCARCPCNELSGCPQKTTEPLCSLLPIRGLKSKFLSAVRSLRNRKLGGIHRLGRRERLFDPGDFMRNLMFGDGRFDNQRNVFGNQICNFLKG